METILGWLQDFVAAIHSINQKYQTPRIKMTRMVALSLLMLRVYLIGMVLLLAFKFVTLVIGQ
jgi:hypothetical protein